MTIKDRRLRDREARRRFITATARALAEREGWDAVTTRRLSAEIEYSQPVIYKHFASMEDLVEAIALEGFAELAQALCESRRHAAPDGAVATVARAYISFAAKNPVLYDAMFSRPSRLHFAAEDSAPSLKAAFAELRAAVDTIAGERDVDTLSEVLWAALHGLATLGRNDRLRPGHDTERIDLLVAHFRAATPGDSTPAERSGSSESPDATLRAEKLDDHGYEETAPSGAGRAEANDRRPNAARGRRRGGGMPQTQGGSKP
jgi:AcrR family transcriptional regulator